MKMLILGANGFIGSHMVGMGISSGFDIYAGVRKKSNCDYLQDQTNLILDIDFSSEQTIVSSLENYAPFDVVISCIGAKQGKKELLSTINDLLIARIVGALETLPGESPPKFIHISSLASMGPGFPGTLTPVRASDTPGPVSYYGKSKLLGEQKVRQSSLPFTIFKPTAVYGPRDMDFLPVFKLIRYGMEVYFNRESQYLSLIHVKDFCRAVFLSLYGETGGKEYLISDGQAYSLEEIYRILKGLMGRRRTFRFVIPEKTDLLLRAFSGMLPSGYGSVSMDKLIELRQRNWLCDNSVTWGELNFKPQFDLLSGFDDTLHWYRENGLI